MTTFDAIQIDDVKSCLVIRQRYNGWGEPIPPWANPKDRRAQPPTVRWMACCTRCLDAVEYDERDKAKLWMRRHAAALCETHPMRAPRPRPGDAGAWTPEEDAVLAAHPGMKPAELSGLLCRTPRQISRRRELLARRDIATGPARWSELELWILRGCRSLAAACLALPDRSRPAIRDKARRIGHVWEIAP